MAMVLTAQGSSLRTWVQISRLRLWDLGFRVERV